MVKVKMFKAEEGDAFLISFGEDQNLNIMIDMGLEKTYQNYIKPELINLSSMGKKIDVLVISHIDKDHIGGALKFIEENGEDQSIIKVEDVWHNTYRHMQFDKEKIIKVTKEEINELKALKMRNKIRSDESGLEDIAVEDGISFGSSLLKFNYNWNLAFKGGTVCSDKLFKHNIGGLNIILLSPNQRKLKELSKKWIEKLDDIIYGFNISDEEVFDDAFEYYMQNEKIHERSVDDICIDGLALDIESLSNVISSKDNSKTNGASISFIIEYKKNKLLFLGDAHEDIIFNNLSELKSINYDLSFDMVKVSHHASNRNISNRLLSLIECRKFLISTNGKMHNHPNVEAISKIIMKSSKQKKEIIFNYNLSKMEFLDDEFLKSKYNYDYQCCNEVILP